MQSLRPIQYIAFFILMPVLFLPNACLNGNPDASVLDPVEPAGLIANLVLVGNLSLSPPSGGTTYAACPGANFIIDPADMPYSDIADRTIGAFGTFRYNIRIDNGQTMNYTVNVISGGANYYVNIDYPYDGSNCISFDTANPSTDYSNSIAATVSAYYLLEVKEFNNATMVFRLENVAPQ